MPHIYIEYSANVTGLDELALMQAVNAFVCNHPTVGHESDVKARCQRVDSFVIGTAARPRGFVHVQLQFMEGRPPEIRQQLSEGIAAALHQHVPRPPELDVVQLSVDIADMTKHSYYKGEK